MDNHSLRQAQVAEEIETESTVALGEESESGGIVAFAFRYPHLIVVACLMTAILGALAAVILPKDLLPPANLPAVQILSFYPGMPVEHVENELTYFYERYTGQAVGMERQESRSINGVAVVKNYFNPSIDLSNALAQTGSMVMSVLRKLPPGAQPPLILPLDPMASSPLAMVAVSGDKKTEAELMDVARYQVTNAIQSVTGAMAPAVMGGKMKEMIAYLDPLKLKQFNLSPVEVMQTLAKENTFIPAGDVKLGKIDYQVNSNGLIERPDEIDNVDLRAQNGTEIRVKDVGHAINGAAIQTNVVLINGKPQAYVPVYRQPGANSLSVVADVRQTMKKLGHQLDGFTLDVVADQSIFIKKAIESISHEALIGGGFAAIMVLFFLGSLRATFAVLLSLPLSLLGAFIFLKAVGQTLNVMTLGGVALSVGVLVDNAIVVIEVIMQKRSLGMDPYRASYHGAREVALPVLASTLSTLIVFFPVLFTGGVIRILFSALAIAVIAAMISSYFVAMTVIPLFSAHYLEESGKRSRFLNAVQGTMNKVIEAYGQSLSWVLNRRKAVLPIVSLTLIATGFILAPHIGAELFPRADSGGFRIDLRAPTGYRIEETTQMAKEVEKKFREWMGEDLKMVITNAGVYYGFSAAFTPNSGTQDFFLNVELKEDRKHTSQYYAKIIRERLPKAFPQLEFGIELGGLLTSALNGGLRSPIDIQIGGKDQAKSAGIAEGLISELKAIPGAVDVRIQQKFDAPQIDLQVDRRKASQIGLTPEAVVKNVVSALANSFSFWNNVWINPKNGVDYPFGVQFPENAITTIDQFKAIPITSSHQERSVPLSQIASTRIVKGPIELNHANLERVIDIYMDAQGRDIAGVAGDVQKVLNKSTLPAGYWAQVRGEVAAMKNAIAPLGGGFLLAAVLVYLILVVQFRSFMLPAIMMTTVPMGMVGVIIIMVLWPTYFSIQAAIGCIFVIGVAVSHGVLLVEFILECSRHEKNIDAAILEGAKARWRPITMTSLASILGLLPMAFGIGHGAEANIPLGRAVIGGQIASTLLNFYLVPCLFRLFYRAKERKA